MEGIRAAGKELGEVVIEGLDEGGLGAEVGGEMEGGEGEGVGCGGEAAGVHGVDEALDAGLAEEVDGLLGVADEEDGLAVAVPALGEELEELVLRGGGVLHLVDEKMLEVHVGGGAEVVEGGAGAQGGAGEEAELGEVAGAVGAEDELELGEGAAEDVEEGFGDAPLIGGVGGGGEGVDAAELVHQASLLGEGGDDVLELGLVLLEDFEADVVGGGAFAPVAGLGGFDEEVDDGAPVVEVFGFFARGLVAVAADGDGRDGALVAFGAGHLGGEVAEAFEDGWREKLVEAGEAAADGEIEGTLELGEDDGVEVGFVEFRLGERDELAPLIAAGEHAGDVALAGGEVAVAMEEDGFEGLVEAGVGAAELEDGAADGFGVEGGGVRGGGAGAAGAGEDRQAGGDVHGERVDGADVEAVGLVEEAPGLFRAAGVVAVEYGLCEGAGLAVEGVGGWSGPVGGEELGEDALVELGGGFAGEGDGEDLGRVGDVVGREQFEESLHKQAGLAGAGGGFDDEGPGDVEGLLALGCVGEGAGGDGLGRQHGEEVRHSRALRS